MTEQFALRKLQSITDSLIGIWAIKLNCKIAPVKVRWANLFNVGGEYDCGAHTITLNKMSFDKLGFYQIERILRHEIAHAICWKVFENRKHDKQFADINRQVDGIE